jgi:hypothetical protein
MRKVAASLVAVLFASPVFAGTVGFGDGQVIPVGTASIDMSVSVDSSSLADFDTVFMVVGSDRADMPLSFVYAPSFVSQTTLTPADPVSFGVYPNDVAFGGNDFAAPFFTAPLLVGTLTINTAALPEGTYEVFVSASRETEMIGSALSLVAKGGVNTDELAGSGTFTVVPEPATLLMLGLGGLTAACRRRK